ncbi:MAG: short coiled-coil protein, partial [Gemmatimonadaceae bacterium]|nr:short coiled-coil protein [Gemmatimonadaceae bacterium]
MMQPQQPAPPPAVGPSGDLKVTIGKDGMKVVQAGDGEAIAALQSQAQVLKARLDKLTSEIDAVKAEVSAPG